MGTSEKEHKKRKFPKKAVIILGILFLVILIGVGTYFYLQYKKNQELLKNPTIAAQVEAKTLLASVGRLMELPTDEQPTIATVSDVSKLKDQPFFAKAKNGYKVLIYPKAQKAILYDPATNKIIEVGPVNTIPTVAPTVPVKVALYNGTSTTGLTTTIEKELKDKGTNVVVIEKTNAAKANYTKTLVVDLTGKQASSAQAIAKLLGGEVGQLPTDETAPKDAEILIILGK